VVQPAGSELERGSDIIGLKIRHLVRDLIGCQSGGEQIQDIGDADAHATDARSTAALLWIDGNAVHQLGHDSVLPCHVKHSAARDVSTARNT
jgi:hypothetical protein